MGSDGESVIAFPGDSKTRCLRAHHKIGEPGEYSSEHRLSQNPGDSEADSTVGHPGPDTAVSLGKDASCRYWVGFEKQRGCYINPSRKWRQPRIWKGSGMAWQEWWFVLYVGTMPQAAVGSCYIWREARKLCWDAQHMLLSYVATLFWLGLRLWLIKSGTWCNLEVCTWVGSGSRPVSL